MEKTKFLEIVDQIVKSGLGAPVLMVVMLAMVILPLPPFLLDLFFTFNIAFSLIILFAGVYTKRPLEFAAFPTVMLIATLLRLALNIASTRVVLLDGHTGTAAAGKVIQAFGDFVVGGNYAVGMVVFSILVIINFVVVTKGAGRVSEVTARFTLDAMPGKQMAIDADLNAGLIDPEEALQRRNEVMQESDYYGAMDGASKFIRGDAVAGILILVINIIGGLAIGTLTHGMPLTDALHNYTLLTVGDGLVAQIPSLVLSTAAAIMVTRVSSSQDMGQQIMHQMFDNTKGLIITASVVGGLGVVPGMPHVAFLSLAGLCGVAAYLIEKKKKDQAHAVQEKPPEQPREPAEPKELSWDDVVPVDTIGLEVGYRLIPLVDKTQGGQLMTRIKGVRKKLTQELGFLVPPVHIRDNLDLAPNAYSIHIKGVSFGEHEIYPDKEFAINPGHVLGSLDGIAAKDPAFNLDAVWVDAAKKDEAQTLGYTVVDASTVIATHLSQILKNNAKDLLGREEVQQLLDNLGKSFPKLVEDLIPKTLPLGIVVRVLQNLLTEDIPIRDMRTIAETLAESGIKSQDPDVLTAYTRIALSKSIVQHLNGTGDEIQVMTLDPQLEQILQQSVQAAQEGESVMEPTLAERFHQSLTEATVRREMAGLPAVLLVAPSLRQLLAKFVRQTIANLHVLSYNEIPENKQVKIVSTVGA